MRVFFTCSTSKFLDNYDRYRKLCSHIKKLGHDIADDWLDEAYRNIQQKNSGDSNNVYERKIKAINNSNIIIAEASYKSFTVGHQITMGLNKAIPVLLIYKARNKHAYIEGIKSNWLTQKVYTTDQDALDIITNFLKLYSSKPRTYRFNLVINQEENGFLEKQMASHNQTKTEIIRGLIQDAINTDWKSVRQKKTQKINPIS